MRILYDSKQLCFKTPFGTLTPGEECTLHLHIPASVRASRVACVLTREDGSPFDTAAMAFLRQEGDYHIFRGSFRLHQRGLYFYYFRIDAPTGPFRLFRQGDDTNMEAGDLWQVSCVPEEHTVPPWAQGAVIYQVFPDRFHKAGACDPTHKQTPYTLHECWDEEVVWQPNAGGKILNNDFFGGNFRGITEKMDYIASLGTTILYLNPISKSFSNHRYDTGDYKTPDPLLGTEADFVQLCQAAHDRGIRVILDGVFSHTGSDSLYFNREGSFGEGGAYRDPDSPFRSWFTFRHWPDSYESWWGFDTLPTVNKLSPSFAEYIITGEDSVVAHWLRLGADGFRLDVADELPDSFIASLKRRIRALKPDALLIGEVWEDASNKVSYNIRRRYFVDGALDSVMNYPFRTAIRNYIRGSDDGSSLRDTVMTLAENYPPQVLHCCMTLLGTHDTARILTALMGDSPDSREEAARSRLSPEQYVHARQLLMAAAFLQYTLPGAPSLYYGDEAGMEGHKDPFNRRPFPWGREDTLLQAHFRRLGQLRRNCEPLRRGNIRFFRSEGGRLGFTRSLEGKTLRICMNRSSESWPLPGGKLLFGCGIETAAEDGITLAPMGFCICEEIEAWKTNNFSPATAGF